jgi:integrase/recombinase XerD
MFDQLFKRSDTIRRHSNAPYAEEHRQYLAACVRQGNTKSTLLFGAQDLLWVARKLSVYPNLSTVKMEQVRAVSDDWKKRERACGRPLNKAFTRQFRERLSKST